VEAIEVEILLSNQGSQKVNVEKSSIAFSSRSVSITFKSSESSKEVHPGSTEAFVKLLFVAIANVKCCTLSFLVLLPITINSLDLLDLIIVSVPTVRRHDATPPSFSATVLTTLRPHGLTLLSSVLSRPNTRMVKRLLQPRSSHKRGSPVPGPRHKPHVHPSLASPPLLFFPRKILATLPLEHLSHLSVPHQASSSSVFVHDVKKKLGSGPEEGLKPN
jgi:hypothetical protein